MLSHYFKMYFRQARHHLLFTIINVSGLGLGIAIFILIAMFVNHETSFDEFFPNSENIYRLETSLQMPGQERSFFSTAQGGYKKAVENLSPNLLGATQFIAQPGASVKTEEGIVFSETVFFSDPNFFEMFNFEFLSGNPARALENVNSVVLSEEMAARFFGTSEALGKVLTLSVSGATNDYQVSGVFKKLPENTHFTNEIVVRLDEIQAQRMFSGLLSTFKEQWGIPFTFSYFKFSGPVDFANIEQGLMKILDQNSPKTLEVYGRPSSELWEAKFVALEDIHLKGNPDFAPIMKPSSSYTTILLLFLIGVLILGVAIVNYVNLTTAHYNLRVKEVSLRKVFGAKQKTLFVQYLGESLFNVLISFSFAMVLVSLALPWYNFFLSKLLTLGDMVSVLTVLSVIGFVFLTGFIGGFYPSIFLSRIKPGQTLKSNRSSSQSSKLRKGLVVFQFVVSISLIIGTSVLYKQLELIRNVETGYSRDDLVAVAIPGGSNENSQLSRNFLNRVKQTPGITSVSRHQNVPGRATQSFMQTNRNPHNKKVVFQWYSIDDNFFETYKVEAVSGRLFSNLFPSQARFTEEMSAPSNLVSVVINEMASDALGFESPEEAVGNSFWAGSSTTSDVEYAIIGVIPTINWQTARVEQKPEAFFKDSNWLYTISIRSNPGTFQNLVPAIEQAWQEIYPDAAINIEVLDDVWNAQISEENFMGTLLIGFSALAIFISIMGLFGLASHYSESQKKDIAIRKIHGASVLSIVKLQLWEYSKPALLATPIAWALSWYYLGDFLDQFVYRVSLSPEYFLGATSLAILISWLTLMGFVVSTAISSPAKALQYE